LPQEIWEVVHRSTQRQTTWFSSLLQQIESILWDMMNIIKNYIYNDYDTLTIGQKLYIIIMRH